MLIVFIRAVIVYCVLILSVRLMGKRQIGELQPSELAITILISNICTLPVEDINIPLFKGLIPVLTLVCLDVIMSWAGMCCGRIRSFMSGHPIVIVSNGEIDQKRMCELRFTVDDLMEAIREQNIFDISEVQFAVVETTGKISVYPKYPYRGVTNEDLGIKGKSTDPPVLLIDDGVLLKDKLCLAGIGMQWLNSELSRKKLKIDDIYMMTIDPNDRKYTLIKKEDKKK